MMTGRVVRPGLDLTRQLGAFLRKGKLQDVRRPAEYVNRYDLAEQVRTRTEGVFERS